MLLALFLIFYFNLLKIDVLTVKLPKISQISNNLIQLIQ